MAAVEEVVVVDADVANEPADSRASFEASTQAMRSWVLLDEGFSALRGLERIDAAALARLRAHVLVMRHGRFGHGDTYASLAEDVEALVGEHLRSWMRTLPAHEPARIVISAHDAMVAEEETLRLARHQAGWWLANGVYPIHILWESGFGETLLQVLEAARIRALGANEDFDGGIDPLLEGAVRVLGGPTLWAGVKRGAERAFDHDGGGRRLLTLLRDELAQATRPIELHLVGFGAGANLQAQLVRHLASNRMIAARTLSLTAPTLSVAEFRSGIAPFLGFALRHVSVFTLARDLERSERCGSYRKSFLSLLRGALEEEPNAEVVGLEESLRRSPDVARMLGLAGASSSPGEALFAGIAPGLTEAKTLSGFDDDVATMNSVLRRVMDQPLGGIIGYQSIGAGAAGEGSVAASELALDRRLEEEFARRGIDFAWIKSRMLNAEGAVAPAACYDGEDVDDVTPAQPSVDVVPIDWSPATANSSDDVGDGASTPEVEIVAADLDAIAARRPRILRGERPASPLVWDGVRDGTHRRRSLSIGIDRTVGRPLNGATADALLWTETFDRLGFETAEPLLDEAATRSAILSGIRSLLSASRAGDVVAVHFSGCGAMLGDAWSEEHLEGAGRTFEALVPSDADSGAFILGGDLAELLRDADEGVQVNFFLDCSFAGGTSRIHGAHLGEDHEETPDPDGERDTDIEPLHRTMHVSESFGARHVAFRRRAGQLLRPGAGWDESPIGARANFFLAARVDEAAWERDGYGDFSLSATRVLRTSAHELTNAAFLDRVREILSESSPQRPDLECFGVARSAPLFLTQTPVLSAVQA